MKLIKNLRGKSKLLKDQRYQSFNGSFKNHWIEASDWLSKNLNQSEGVFLSYHSQQNRPHHVKGYWKLFQKMVSFCVPFCLRSLRRFERFVLLLFNGILKPDIWTCKNRFFNILIRIVADRKPFIASYRWSLLPFYKLQHCK